MRTPSTALAVCLVLVLAAACGESEPPREPGRQIADELLIPRPQYDLSASWSDLVRPHFFARSESGDVVAIQGSPELVVEREGKIKVRLASDGQKRYVDLLALESERVGEHPVHKVFRLDALGVPMEEGLRRKLRPDGFAHDLFHTLDFQYLPDKDASGVITELLLDGTFLVVPFGAIPEWESDRQDVATLTHFHVDPRALSAKRSLLAAEYEKEILALPFDDRRYPPASLARKQCDVYLESRRDQTYNATLASIGYEFTPDHIVPRTSEAPPSLGEGLRQMLSQGSGEGVWYLGFEGSWVGRLLAELGVAWIGECDTAGALRRGPGKDDVPASYYIIVRRSLQPDKTDRYKILRIDNDGSGHVIYDAPGIMLMAMPLPFDTDLWIMSTEGWRAPAEAADADPRWQSVYLVDMDSPGRYDIVEYPISRYPRAPEQGLYGSSPLLTEDSRFLFSNLYGFEDEGGGLWVADLSDEGFYEDGNAFSRIVPWDHALSWAVLDGGALDASGPMWVLLTAKEVGDDTAMTANLLRINRAGLDSRVELKKRLIRMVGWNPVPLAVQRISEHEFWVAVETHFNYEASLLPRAKGVYLMSIGTESGRQP